MHGTRAQYARHRGVNASSVTVALKTGRIGLTPAGKIDFEEADRQWDLNTDAAFIRKRRGTPPASVGPPGPAEPAEAPVDGTARNFANARAAHEVTKVRISQLRLQRMRGELVDKNRATITIYNLAKRERDAWLNWPARVAATMAAEINAEPHTVQAILSTYVRQHLSELSEIRPDLSEL
jgi:hypothetical protein